MTGPLHAVWLLGRGDLRSRIGQSLLLALVMVIMTGTLTLALGLRHVGQESFASTRAVTRGPDVVVVVGPRLGGRPVPASRFAGLLHASGVRRTLGPLPVAFVDLTAAGVNVPVQAQGRRARRTPVDRPKVVAGTWVRNGGVVLERGLATTLGLRLGDVVHVGTRRFTVAGIAISTAEPFYPAQVPGVVWLSAAAARGLSTRAEPTGELLEIRLTHPSLIDRFLLSGPVNAFARDVHRRHEQFQVTPVSFIRDDDHKLIVLNQRVLMFGSYLLVVLAITSIAILVGGRMAEQRRRIGLLKAVGATPALVTVVLLSEMLLLALVGAIIGLIVGSLLAPSFASSGSGLLHSSGAPRIHVTDAALVLAVALASASAATFLPAIRAARVSTVQALMRPSITRRRGHRLPGIVRRLPAPLSLAMRIVGRRTQRTTFNALALMTAVAMIVAALTVQHNLDLTNSNGAVAGPIAHNTVANQADHVLIGLSVILAVLALTTAAFTAWATVVDAQRSSAMARALGATPRQVSSALTTAQLLPALTATCAGIPAGLLLYQLAGGHLSEAAPPITWLIAVIPLTLLVVAGLTAPLAQLSTCRPVADVLRTD